MKLSTTLKKTVFAAATAMVMSGSALAETRFVAGIVPHYHEFNTAENPSKNYWCGHTALKIVAQYKGKTKNSNEIIKLIK